MDENPHLLSEVSAANNSSIGSRLLDGAVIEFSDQFLQNEALSFTTFAPFQYFRKGYINQHRANVSYWLNDLNWAEFEVWVVNLRSGKTVSTIHVFESFQVLKDKVRGRKRDVDKS